MKLEEFLERNRIPQERWENCGLNWQQLTEIAADYETWKTSLFSSAQLFATSIQNIPLIHSVRWRVKDTEHLLEKLVRKSYAKEEKYASLDAQNYATTVTDLVGLRALHLFKEDWKKIHEILIKDWTPIETPVAYYREGDPEDLLSDYRSNGLETKEHRAGYRSIHYVFESKPQNRIIKAEVQIRTIFEEGWSEIDHQIRYPNFSNNEVVAYFLTIFNRLAGSADEMGSFARSLAAALQAHRLETATLSAERDKHLLEMERLIEELDRTKAQDNEAEKTVQKLKNQIKQLKQEQSREPSLGSNHNALAKLLSETSIQRLAREMSETQDRLKTMYAEPSATKSLKEFIDAMNKYNK